MTDEKKPRVVAIIQARMGSTRLPGKVMMDIGGKPMLQRVIERVKLAKTIDAVVVAVPTDDMGDTAFTTAIIKCDVALTGGSLDDVLARYAYAAKEYDADVIVRITADCPLIDPGVIDMVVQEFLDKRPDYASNTIERTWPRGLDVEVFSRAAFERAASEATEPCDREHVTSYFVNPMVGKDFGGFSHISVTGGETDGKLNWSVNTQEDLDRVRWLYSCMSEDFEFTWEHILNVANTSKAAAEIDARKAVCTTRKVAIIGTAPSSRDLAPYQDPSWEIWSLSNRVVTDQLPRWDRHFELHPLSQFERDPEARPYVDWMHRLDGSKPIYLQDIASHPGIKGAVQFPYGPLLEVHGKYFTSTIAWQIALAIHEGVDEIGLWGIDLMLQDEYAHQRPCVEKLVGFAEARGIKVTIPSQSSLCKPQLAYGIEGEATPRAALVVHQNRLKGMVQQFQGERDQAALKMAHAQGAVEGLEFALQMTG